MAINEFGANMKSLAKKRRLSIAELGRRTGIGGTMLYRFINGKALPSLDKAEKIAECLNVTIDTLINSTEIRNDCDTVCACYMKATDEDRNVVRIVLKKYLDKQEEDNATV